jgi:WD40 repeat protein
VIWHIATATPVNSPLALGASGNQLAFSSDSRLLAAALGDGRALTINAATGRPMRTLHPYEGSNGGTVSVAFARDGTLATGDYAGLVQLWNPTTGDRVGHPLLVNAAPVASIAFDPSGARFATTGGPGGGLKLWFTSSLQQDGATLDPEQASYGTAVFADRGRSLISIDGEGKASIWPITASAWERHACAVAGRNLTREEWSRFVSGYSYQPACP